MNDRKLPGLRRATNDDAMRSIFSNTLLRNAAGVQSAGVQVQHDVVKYTPGKRCVIAYHLASPETAGDAGIVIGKLYRKKSRRKNFSKFTAALARLAHNTFRHAGAAGLCAGVGHGDAKCRAGKVVGEIFAR